MSSILKVDTIQDQSGNNIINESGNVITIGASGDTITVPAGATVSGFTSAGIDDNATSVAITIDSSERVGIGTTAPGNYYSNKLVIDCGSASQDGLTIVSESTKDGMIGFADGTSGNDRFSGFILYDHADNEFRIATNAAERMRITSAGDLLVGTTSANPGVGNTNTGFSVTNSGGQVGHIAISQNGNYSANFNRNTNDGTVVQFSKNGTTVGTIASGASNTLIIGTDTCGVRFYDISNVVQPRNTNGSSSDNTISLGMVNNRFKDVVLGGGVFLGGTGTANKLDDYEEGTWTPVYEGGTSNPTITYDGFTHGTYNKIGNMVFARGYIRTDATSGGSGGLLLAGFPFNFPAQAYGATILTTSTFGWSTQPAFSLNDSNADTVNLYDASGNGLTTSNLTNGANKNVISFLAVYQV